MRYLTHCSFIFFFLTSILSTSTLAQREKNCEDPISRCDPTKDYFPYQIKIEYANKTIKDIKYQKTFVDFTIRGEGDDEIWKYRVIPCGCSSDQMDRDRQLLVTNPTSLYIGETPSLALYYTVVQGNRNSLTYINNKDYVYDPEIRAAANRDVIKQIRDDYSILGENSAFSYGIVGKNESKDYTAADIDAPYLVTTELDEINALARAEWLKIFAILFKKEEDVTKLFNETRDSYNDIKEKASKAQRRPSVLFNQPTRNGNSKDINKRYQWSLPGGNQYILALLEDANGVYRYNEKDSDDPHVENMDTVVKDFASARISLHVSSYPGIKQLSLKEWIDPKRPDEEFKKRMEKLASVKCGQVYTIMKSISDDGKANDFFESGIVKPDKVLLDYVKAIHPDFNLEGDFTYAYLVKSEPADVKDCPYPSLLEEESGRKFVDKKFNAPGKSRFEVEDGYLKSYAEIEKKINGTGRSVDLFFMTEDKDKTDTEFLLRVSVPEDKVNSTNLNQIALPTLRKHIDNTVDGGSGSSTTNKSSDGDGKGGIGAGGIVGIVIAILVVIGVIGFAFFRKKGSQGGHVRPSGGDEFWASNSPDRHDGGFGNDTI